MKTTRELYCQYLLSSRVNYTCTNLADHFADLTHDDVSRFLKESHLTPKGCISVLSSSRSNLVDHVVPLAAEITSPQVEYVLGVWDGPSLP